MAKRNLFDPNIGQSTVDDLYNGTLIPRKTRPAAVSGDGVLKRGSPLSSDDGETFRLWEPGEEIRGILLYDIDCDETEEAENAVLGISGEFNQNKVEEALGLGDDEELDADAIMGAWGRQIHIEPNYKYPEAESFPLG